MKIAAIISFALILGSCGIAVCDHPETESPQNSQQNQPVEVKNNKTFIEAAPGPQTIYFYDFEKKVPAEWSSSKTDITPLEKRHFLGQFANETVTLFLEKLPPPQRSNPLL